MDSLKKWMIICMVHTTPNHHLTKMNVHPKAFFSSNHHFCQMVSAAFSSDELCLLFYIYLLSMEWGKGAEEFPPHQLIGKQLFFCHLKLWTQSNNLLSLFDEFVSLKRK